MHRINELIDILSDDEVACRSTAARYSGTCKICGKAAGEFRTPFAELEYGISSLSGMSGLLFL